MVTFYFPCSFHCQFLRCVSYTPVPQLLLICVLIPCISGLWKHSTMEIILNIASCLPQFNNLFSIHLSLNLSNSLDSWSLSLFTIRVLLLFSASFSFSIADTFLLVVHNCGSYSNLGLCFLLVPLKTHMLCRLVAFHVPLSGFSPLLQSHLCKAKWQYKFVSLTLLETQPFLNKYYFPWNYLLFGIYTWLPG